MKKALQGIMIGIAMFFILGAANPPKVEMDYLPQPPKKEFRDCKERILYRLNFYSELLVKMQVPYVWGGYWGILGVDCSGYMYWICRMAGLPVKRMTSLRMWLDKGAWPGERVAIIPDKYDRAQFPDLLFWTYKASRPKGHVALVMLNAEDHKGKRTILFREASSSQKIVKDTEMKQGDYRWVRVEGIIILDLTPGFKCEG